MIKMDTFDATMEAVKRGDIDTIESYVSTGIISPSDEWLNHPIILAISMQHYNISDYLLNITDMWNQRVNMGHILLALFSENRIFTPMIHYIVNKGYDINLSTKGINIILDRLTKWKRYDIIKILILYGILK